MCGYLRCVLFWQNPLNKLSDQVRQQVAEAGFTEALTFSLVRFSPSHW